MTKSVLRFPGVFPGLFLFVLSVSVQINYAQAQSKTYALTNAKIVTVSGATIDKGTVVIRDGLIENVGAGVSVPADAMVVDATGLTVYPGFFDANSGVGIPAPQQTTGARGPGGGGGFQAQQAQQQTAPQTNSNYPTGLQPEVSAAELIRASEASVEAARSGGFTTVLSVPRERIFNGQSALINTAGDSASEMILRAPVAIHISFVPLGGGNYPVSMMGSFSALRQMFLDAQRLQAWRKTYEKDPRGIKRPEADKSLEALFPVINREIPAAFNANTAVEILRVLDFAKEFNLNPVIVGGQEAWKVTDRLKAQKAVVLLSLNFPRRTTASAPDADPESLETMRFRVETPKGAAQLKRAGVAFAFQSGGMANLADFLTNAAKTVENGLSKDDALKAMTLSSAEIFGVADRLGSIEKGKIANLVVIRGEAFDRTKTITHVFVDGKMFEQKPPATTPGRFNRGGTGPGNPAGGETTPGANPAFANIAGNWTITIEIPGQPSTGTAAFAREGERMTGSVTTQRGGTNQIKNGKVTADGFTFDMSISLGGQSIDLTFTGKVNGNQISGTVSTPQGSMPFSGTRNP